MKRLTFALTLGTLIMACTPSSADFPRRRSGCNIVSPCFAPVCHEVAVVPSVTVIEVPSFVFFNYSGSLFPGGQQYQSQQYQAPAAFQAPAVQQQTAQVALALTDQQMEKLANMVAAKLQGSTAGPNVMSAPPAMADEPAQPPQQLPQAPAQMPQAIVNDLGAKCSACHMSGSVTKGGLAIFDQSRTFRPTLNGQPYATPQRLWQRIEDGSMPPTAATDPGTRPTSETFAFLKTNLP